VHNPGLLAGNMLLAEDRILSYASVFLTGRYTRWVPAATFLVEAEVPLTLSYHPSS
jgi:hypothetical protein